MANPSTVNPTASGKEVLRRTYLDGQGESAGIILTAPTDHICTIISMFIQEREGLTDAQFDLHILPDGGSAFMIMMNQPISSNGTFVFNDKLVMTGGDVLKIEPHSAGGVLTMDIWCSYIDQDWS
mgnify:CR=1 FL=1